MTRYLGSRSRTHATLGVAAVASLIALAGCGSGSGSSPSAAAASGGGGGSSTNWAQQASVSTGGGMSALVAAAKKEGTLNVITLPKDWANYGTIMTDFTKKYGIKINDANPDGTSQDEINAMKQLKGQSRAPDVLDMGTSFAITAAASNLLAPYKVASWNQIPSTEKSANGDWFDDYGGYVAIGYNPAKVKIAPTSFADLLKPQYAHQVAINGNPTEAGAAFAAVYAAALANHGSFDNITPGIDYFKRLHDAGNFVPVTGSAATVQSGQTPILVFWDYLLASEVQSQLPGFKIVIPTDGHYAAYYSQAISASAPHPAAARLWEEYLYSTTGQNLWLDGKARPAELPTLVQQGTVDQTAFKTLPAAPSATLTFPTPAQLAKAQTVVTQQWAKATG
jgi:putative spermidine/putrescine transport system substrate-binding protein